MKIFIAGGTGVVGSYLAPFLVERSHDVRLLVRPGINRERPLPSGVEVIEGNPLQPGPWWEAVQDCDAAVNLVGTSIQGWWTTQKQALIRTSRLMPLEHLAHAVPTDRPFTVVSASAVGYYGDAGERELDESAPHGRDFLATLARDWESMAKGAAGPQTRVATTRFGLVLGPDGGALHEMVKAMKRFMGGILGSGRQWVSWIHQEDLARAILFLLEQPDARDAYNLSSPGTIRQADFARTLARHLHRPTGVPTPTFVVRMTLGGFADAVLFSQRMVPKRLLDAGFEFRYPTLDEALTEIFARQSS
jgi:uncharacterized protein (TIGR01777 family)